MDKIIEHGGDTRVFRLRLNQKCIKIYPLTQCWFLIFDIYSKWRTTPVVEEVFAEGSAQVAGVAAVDAAGAVEGAVVPGVASPKTRR